MPLTSSPHSSRPNGLRDNGRCELAQERTPQSARLRDGLGEAGLSPAADSWRPRVAVAFPLLPVPAPRTPWPLLTQGGGYPVEWVVSIFSHTDSKCKCILITTVRETVLASGPHWLGGACPGESLVTKRRCPRCIPANFCQAEIYPSIFRISNSPGISSPKINKKLQSSVG